MGNCKSKTGAQHVAAGQEVSRTSDDVPKLDTLSLTADKEAKHEGVRTYQNLTDANVPTAASLQPDRVDCAAADIADDETVGEQLVFVLGGPGSGKGTQCEMLRERFGFVHLSVGDLLRDAAAEPESPLTTQLQDIMRDGRLVPDDLVITMLQRAIAAAPPGSVILINGFPRSLEQARVAEQALGAPMAVLRFDCSEETMKAGTIMHTSISHRILGRAKSSGRVDDTEDALAKRLKTFEQETLPVKSCYQERGLLRVVDAEPPPDAVFTDVAKLVEEFSGATAATTASSTSTAAAAAAPETEGTADADASREQGDSSASPGCNSGSEAGSGSPAVAAESRAARSSSADTAAAAADLPAEAEDNLQAGHSTDLITPDMELAAAADQPSGSTSATGSTQQQGASQAAAEAAVADAGAKATDHPAAEVPIMASTSAASKAAKASAARKSVRGSNGAGRAAPSTAARRSKGPRVSGSTRSASPTKRRTTSGAPVAAFPGLSKAASGPPAAARPADEVALPLDGGKLADASPGAQSEATSLPQKPPAVLTPDPSDDPMMADAKRIAAQAIGLGSSAAARTSQDRRSWTRTGSVARGSGSTAGSRKSLTPTEAMAAVLAEGQAEVFGGPKGGTGKERGGAFSWIYGADESIATAAQLLTGASGDPA